MALTATANLATRRMIIKNLKMHGCYLKSKNPNRANIHRKNPPDIMEAPFLTCVKKVKGLIAVLFFAGHTMTVPQFLN